MYIFIQTQEDFDALDTHIKVAMQEPGDEDIVVLFASKIYYFSEAHLSFLGVECPNHKVSIIGNGATIIGAGTALIPKHRLSKKYDITDYDWRYGVIDLDNLADVRPIGPVKRALGPVEVLDETTGLCRFKASEKKNKNPKQTSVQFTNWYLGLTYPVVKIEKGYIYFSVDDLKKDGDYYNIEWDRMYKNVYPKYQLVNSPKAEAYWCKNKLRFKNRGKRYHICKASKFLDISDSVFKAFEVRGLNFLGNSDLEKELIYIRNCAGNISFHNCTFKGIRNHVISASSVKQVSIYYNVVEGCYRGFYAENPDVINTSITRNTFRGNQLFFGNFFDVTCLGQNFKIVDNVFEDFAYGAIGVGVHFASPPAEPPVTSGIVENNEMYQTKKFRKEPTRTLMDSGAIYCWTSNLNVVLKNNYIHDYTGGGDNRGIFLDDGTNNVTVVGNTVLRIANSYCIDMRRVTSVETRPDSYVKKTNVGDKLINNFVDGEIRWEPNLDE